MAELDDVPGREGRGPIHKLKLAARPATVPRARSILRQLLCEWHLEQLSDTAMLLMSELVTNAVKASEDGVRGRGLRRKNIMASIRLNDTGLVLEVWDANPAPPVVQEVDLTSDGGRGMLMIECLGDRWGHHAAYGGKVVWCEVGFPADADCVGGHEGADRQPLGWPERLAQDDEAGQGREHRVDIHEDSEEPGRNPPQRQQVGHHRDGRAHDAGRDRAAQRSASYRMAS